MVYSCFHRKGTKRHRIKRKLNLDLHVCVTVYDGSEVMEMYSIGQFVKIANISRRTLHYYNEIGLLPPAKVGENQYRYYDDGALMKLQKILLLKSLGYTLEQIKEVFHRTGQAKKENESWIQSLQEQIEWVDREKELLDWKRYMLQASIHAIQISGKIEAAEINKLIQELQARELKDGVVQPIFSDAIYSERELEILAELPVMGSQDPKMEPYVQLMGAIRQNMHEAPDSPTAQRLAESLYEMALDYFQGDTRLIDKYWEELIPGDGDPAVVYGHDRDLMIYVGEMIGHYLRTRKEEGTS